MNIQEAGVVEIACLNGTTKGEKEELKEGKA